MQIEKVTAASIADGTGTTYSGYFTGEIVCIRYVKVDYADGVDFTITTDAGGSGLWTESNVNASTERHPTDLVDDLVGAASTTRGPCWCLNDRVKIVLAAGGNVKTGTFWIFWK